MEALLIPGQIGRSKARALILMPDGGRPDVFVQEEAGPSLAGSLTRLPQSSDLQAVTDGLEVWVAEVGGLSPATRYQWKLRRQGQVLSTTAFRTFAAVPESFSFVVTSCYYDGFRRAADYAATLDSPRCRDAAFKILTGDNLYLDVDARQRDPNFEDPFLYTWALYEQYFLKSRYREVLGQLPTFSTWDDHEYWNNFPEKVKWLSRTGSAALRVAWKRAGTECLELFQQSLNPRPQAGVQDRSFEIEDCPTLSFFVLDIRSQRGVHKGDDSEMAPESAITRMENWAAQLDRPGVLVLGQPLVIEAGAKKTDLNPPAFEDQYERIWRALLHADWDVLVVSGDVHHSRVLQLDVGQEGKIVEFVSSPACHIPTLTAIATGGFAGGAQDQAEVEFPTRISVPGFGSLSPRYLMGTRSANSIGVIAAHPVGSESVELDFSFLEVTDPGRIADSTRANSGFFGGGKRPVHRHNEVRRVLRLNRRR